VKSFELCCRATVLKLQHLFRLISMMETAPDWHAQQRVLRSDESDMVVFAQRLMGIRIFEGKCQQTMFLQVALGEVRVKFTAPG
jgi:hypothetical protein